MMSHFEDLNRRHKVALFFTLLIVGLILIDGKSILSALGTVLLCLAFTWAFGSNSRSVHYAFLGIGLVLLLGPLVEHWEQWRNYRERVAEFERRIPELASSYPVPERGQRITVATIGQLEQVLAKIGLEGKSGQTLLSRIQSIGPRLKASIEVPVERGSEALTFSPSRSKEEGGHGVTIVVDIRHPDGSLGTIPEENLEKARALGWEPDESPPWQPGEPVNGLLPGRIIRFHASDIEHVESPTFTKVDKSRVLIDVSPITKPYGEEQPYAAVFPESLPEWYLAAVVAGVDLLRLPDDAKPSPEPKAFTLTGYAAGNVVFIVPGLFLTCVGLGLILGVKHRTNAAQPLSHSDSYVGD